MHYLGFVIFHFMIAIGYARIIPSTAYNINKVQNAGYVAYIQPAFTVTVMPNEATAYAAVAPFFKSTPNGLDSEILQLTSLVMNLPSINTPLQYPAKEIIPETTNYRNAVKNTSEAAAVDRMNIKE